MITDFIYNRQIETPCFILDSEELERSCSGIMAALSSRFDKSVVGYSVKTNSLPAILKVAKELGAFAEVVSYDEYHLAGVCGFPKSKIIYNGPMKDKASFIDAIVNEAVVNIETKRELEWLNDLPKRDIPYKVGIRLNINISKVSPDDADGDVDDSRFGFSDETSDFSEALEVILSNHCVRLAGLHIHRTAHSRSVGFYRNSIRYACSVIKKYDLQIDYLDVGGGFFGIFPNKPTYQDYADAFYDELATLGYERLTVIVEPGNALVASAFSFLTSVIDVKHPEHDKWFITTDGSRSDVDPFFKKQRYLYQLISAYNNTDIVPFQVISGCTCLENDRLFVLEDRPLLSVGDKVLYNNVGAYTMALTPLFIRYLPKVYVYDNDTFTLVRDAWSVNEFLQKSVL